DAAVAVGAHRAGAAADEHPQLGPLHDLAAVLAVDAVVGRPVVIVLVGRAPVVAVLEDHPVLPGGSDVVLQVVVRIDQARADDALGAEHRVVCRGADLAGVDDEPGGAVVAQAAGEGAVRGQDYAGEEHEGARARLWGARGQGRPLGGREGVEAAVGAVGAVGPICAVGAVGPI
ncbi:MAG: hypothetical protein ACK559_28795, partial [bacterium]